jgi:PKD repeat protein
MKSKLTLLAFMLFIVSSGFSQCYYYFTGQVTNSNGATIPNAQVTISGTNSSNAVIFSDATTTDPNGFYTFCSTTGSTPANSVVIWEITVMACGGSQTANITSTPNNTQGWQYTQNFQMNCSTMGCQSQINYTYTGQSYIIFNLQSGVAGFPSYVNWNINGNTGQGSGGSYTYILGANESVLNVCATAYYQGGCIDSLCTTINLNLNCYYTFDGYLLDANGVAMPNETVVITGANNGAVAYTATTTTNANGYYSFCFPSINSNTYIWTINSNVCSTNNFVTQNTTPNNQAGSVFTNNINTNCNAGSGCPTVISVMNNNNGTYTFLVGSPGTVATQSIWTVNGVTYNSSPNEPASLIYSLNPNDTVLVVCVTAFFSSGCTGQACSTVVVNNGGGNNCQIDISVNSVGLLNNSINYSGQVISGGAAQFVWSFGNVGTASGQSGVFTFPNAGTYTVCGYAYFSSGCADTVCTTVTVGQNTGNCSANAQVTSTTSTNVVQYTGAGSTGSPNIQYSWNFGDGTTSALMTGTHTFPGPGTYQVCLTITDGTCTDTDCVTITVGSNTGNGTICGCVNMATPAGVYLAPDCGTAYLVQYNSTNNTLTAVQTTTLTPNGYCFTNVPAGAYTVKVALCASSQYYQSYMPTYFGNVLYWFQANQIIVNGNYVNPGTCINLIPGNNPGGPGFIGGSIFQGANKAAVGDPIPGVSVLLLDMVDGSITHTITDANGAYAFPNLAYGTYKIYPEQPGVNTYPIYVTISADEPTATDLNFGLNTGGFVGIEEANILTSSTGIYPNPATDLVNIEINSKVMAEATFTILDLQGRVISNMNKPLVKGSQVIQFNTNEFSSGFYFVRVSVESFSKEFKLIVKH